MKSVNENCPLISVIVPVYKVEPYLDRCVESIVNQTYRNLEIILVDDGSPDNSPQMCDAWAERDSRIKVIHKENGGLSDARNAGMAAATGELMGFVDSDDWIREDMYQLLYENMCKHDSDISACGVKMIWEDGSSEQMLTKDGCCVLKTEEAMLSVIREDWIKQPVWYKLYKTELIRDIPFPVGKYHEDVFWTYQAIGAVKRVSVFDEPCYFYRQRSGSIMGEGYSLKRLDALEAKCHQFEYIMLHWPKLTGFCEINFRFSAMYAYQMALLHLNGSELAEAVDQIKRIIKQNPISLQAMADVSMKQRLWMYMSQISFVTTCRIRNILGIGV